MSSSDFDIARKNMIVGQLAPHGIHEDLQAVFAKVPREIFVTPAHRATVYSDSDTPILGGQNPRKLLSPIKMARFLKAIAKKQNPKVLTLGFGGGYSLALGYEYGLSMFGVEEDEMLLSLAQDNLRHYFETFHNTAHIDNFITLEHAPLTQGLPEHTFYDAIMIEGGVEVIPTALLDQLTPAGQLLCIHLKDPLGVVSVQKNGIITPIHFEKTTVLAPFQEPKVFIL